MNPKKVYNVYVTREGKVYNEKGDERRLYVNGDGYITVLVKIEGRNTTTGVHRLVAMAYVENDRPDRNHVNHIDGDKRNNRAENLDWVTPAENNVHAALINSQSERCTVMIVYPCGKTVSFVDIYHASENTGYSLREIWYSIKDRSKIGDVSFVYLSKGMRIKRSKSERGEPYRGPVYCCNIENFSVTKYSTYRAASDSLNVSESMISMAINSSKLMLVQGKFVLSKNDHFSQSEMNNISERARVSKGIQVLSLDMHSGDIKRWISANAFITANHLSRKMVSVALRKGRIRVLNGMIFAYDRPGSRENLVDFWLKRTL